MKFNPVLRRHVGMAVALVAAGLIGGLGATAANASFVDVPDESNYAEHISNLQEAGIATGYADGSFRPTATMNRRQTAAWLDRSAARVALEQMGDGISTVDLDGDQMTSTLVETEVTSPAAGDGGGWVTIQGGVGGAVMTGGEDCPCIVRVHIRDSSDHLLGTSILTVFDHGAGFAITTAPVLAVVPLAAGHTETYRIDLELLDPDVSVAVGGAIYAIYTPLADGAPEQFLPESGDTGSVESLVPEIPFTGAP